MRTPSKRLRLSGLAFSLLGLCTLHNQQVYAQSAQPESPLPLNHRLSSIEDLHPLKVYLDGNTAWATALKRELKPLEMVVTEGVSAANYDVRIRQEGGHTLLERPSNNDRANTVVFDQIVNDHVLDEVPQQLTTEWRWLFLRRLEIDDSQSPLKVELRLVKLDKGARDDTEAETESPDKAREPQRSQDGRFLLYGGDRFQIAVRNLSKITAYVLGLYLTAGGEITPLGLSSEPLWIKIPADGEWHYSSTYTTSKPYGVDVLRLLVSRVYHRPWEFETFIRVDPLSVAVLAEATSESPLWTTSAVEIETGPGAGEPIETNQRIPRPAIEGLSATKGFDTRKTGAVLNSLGGIYQSLRQDDKAVKFYEQALMALRYGSWSIDYKRDKVGEATTLNNLGLAYEALGRHRLAVENFTAALQLHRELKDARGEVEVLNNLASTYRSLSRHDLAIQLCNQAIRVARTLKDKTLESTTLNTRGFIQYSLSNYTQAINSYMQALVLARQANNVSVRALQAAVLNNLGLAYSALNRYDQAIPVYEQSLSLKRALRDQSSVGVTLNNLGGAYAASARPAKAIEYYEQALTNARERGDHGSEGVILNNLGGAYTSLHQYPKALGYCQQALTLVREVNNRAAEGAILHDIGQIYRYMNRYDDAIRCYDRALPIRREVKDLAGEGFTLNNLMVAYKASHKPSVAVFYGKQAINTYQRIRGSLKPLDKSSQESFLSARKDTYETLAALLVEAGRLPEAEQVSRMLKQSETLEFVRRDATQAGMIESLGLSPMERDYVARYDKLGLRAITVGDRIAALEKIPEEQLTSQQKTELESLYKDRETIKARFEVFRKELVAAFGAVTPDLQTVDIAASDAWQKALKKVSAETRNPTALLTTVIAPDTFYVILTTATTRLRFFTAIKNGDLNALVNRFRAALLNPNVNPQDEAQKLWNVVFCNGQVEKALQASNIKVALWSLSGSLRYVPIDALHDGTAYLVARERLNVVMTTNSKDYFEKPEGGKALAAGTSRASTIQMKDDSGQVETLRFDPLLQVPDEVRGIIHDQADGGIGPINGHILLDKNFSASELQAQLRRGYRTVHVATHFRLQPGDAQKSFLLLGDGGTLPVFDWKVKMPLENVELLTLSACETGLGGDAPTQESAPSTTGVSTGAEVSSLGEVAQLQGASAVVVSLWSVADKSTSLLMRDFYARWHRNPSAGKGEALRGAQRALLGVSEPVGSRTDSTRGVRIMGKEGGMSFVKDPKHPFAHPFYWAPFTLIGNWR